MTKDLFRTFSNDFIYTAETTPAVATSLESSLKKVECLVGVADAINITDAPNCQPKLSSLVAAGEIKKMGLDVILQITGRDRNRIAIESEVMGCLALGINKILCLSGDKPPEDGPKAVNELNSSDIISLLKTMSDGHLSDGTEIQNSKNIISGCADSIYDHNNDGYSDFFLSKANLGVTFVQTQYCFDIDLCKQYSEFIQNHNLNNKIYFLVGLGPLKSAKQASWMRENLYGVKIPDSIIKRLEKSTNPQHEGTAICEEIIDSLKQMNGINGVHLMGPNSENLCAQLIKTFRN